MNLAVSTEQEVRLRFRADSRPERELAAKFQRRFSQLTHKSPAQRILPRMLLSGAHARTASGAASMLASASLWRLSTSLPSAGIRVQQLLVRVLLPSTIRRAQCLLLDPNRTFPDHRTF